MLPDEVRTQYGAATRLFKAHDYDAALHILQELAETRPSDTAIIYSQALCLASLTRYDEAVRLCDRLILQFRDVRGVELRARIAARVADAASGEDVGSGPALAAGAPIAPCSKDSVPTDDAAEGAASSPEESVQDTDFPTAQGILTALSRAERARYPEPDAGIRPPAYVDFDGSDHHASQFEGSWGSDDHDADEHDADDHGQYDPYARSYGDDDDGDVGASVVGFGEDQAEQATSGSAFQARPSYAEPDDRTDRARRSSNPGRWALSVVGLIAAVLVAAYGAWRSGLLGPAGTPTGADRADKPLARAPAAADDDGAREAATLPPNDTSLSRAEFPVDRVLGELDVRPAGSTEASWSAFGPVSGAVAPPEGSECRLRVGEHHWLDLRAIADAASLPITAIEVANSEMTDAALDELERFPALRELTFEHVHQLTDDGLARLAHVPHVESLTLRGTHLLTDDGLGVLVRMPALRRLDVSETTLSDRAMVYLERLKALEALHLPEGTGDIGLAYAAGLVGLQQLSVGRAVTDEGMAVVSSFPRLQRLRVNGSLTAGCVPHLMPLSCLEEVEWRGPLDVKTADALSHLPGLTVLRLTGTELPAGAVERLANAERLHTVELAGVILKEPARFPSELGALARGLRSLQRLVLRNMELPKGALVGLTGHGALASLDLRGSTVTPDDVAALGGAPKLTEVSLPAFAQDPALQAAVGELQAALPECVVLDEVALAPRRISFPMDASRGTLYVARADGSEAAIGRAKGVVPVPASASVTLETSVEGERDLSFLRLLRPNDLHGLRLPCGAVPSGGLQHLAHLSELVELDVTGLSVTDAEIAHMQALGALQSLSLSRTPVTDAGVAALAGVLPGLRRLDLSACDGVTDGAIGILTGLSALESLDLRFTPLTDAGLSGLRVLLTLRRLDVRGTAVTPGGLDQVRSALPDCEILSDPVPTGVDDQGVAEDQPAKQQSAVQGM